jgi:hypothetical protein
MAYPPYSLDLNPCDYFLFAWIKEPLQGYQYESAGAINKTGTVSLHCLSTDDYSTVTNCMSHQWEVHQRWW